MNSRGHFFTQVAPKLYFPSGFTSIWYVVGLYSMSGGQVSLHVASSRNLRQTCHRRTMCASQWGRGTQCCSDATQKARATATQVQEKGLAKYFQQSQKEQWLFLNTLSQLW